MQGYREGLLLGHIAITFIRGTCETPLYCALLANFRKYGDQSLWHPPQTLSWVEDLVGIGLGALR